MENERDVADATLEGHGVRVCMSYGGTELYSTSIQGTWPGGVLNEQ